MIDPNHRMRPMMRAAALAAAAGLFLIAGALAPRSARASQMDFKIDPVASKVTATVAQPMAAVRGSVTADFKIVSGDISGDPSNIAATGRVKAVIDAASFSSGISMRDRDVRNNYLDAARYPHITFESVAPLTNYVMVGPQSMTAALTGNLTIHGVTRSETMPIKATLKDGRLIADGSVEFDYTDFGVKAPVMMFMSAGKTALIKFHIVGDPIAASPSAAPATPAPAAP